MTHPGCFFWNSYAGPLCRSAGCASHSHLSFLVSGILGCPSLVLQSCSSFLVLRCLLMISHHFLSFVPAGSGDGRIPRLLVGVSRLVVFLLSAAIKISRIIIFHPFSLVCLQNGNVRSLNFD